MIFSCSFHDSCGQFEHSVMSTCWLHSGSAAPISITMRLREGGRRESVCLINMVEGCSSGGWTSPCVTRLVQLSPPPFVHRGRFLIRSEMCCEYDVFNAAEILLLLLLYTSSFFHIQSLLCWFRNPQEVPK